MTIFVTKGVRISPETYTIDLTQIELEYLRQVLVSYAMTAKADTDTSMFANKCATIINNELVLNGD